MARPSGGGSLYPFASCVRSFSIAASPATKTLTKVTLTIPSSATHASRTVPSLNRSFEK